MAFISVPENIPGIVSLFHFRPETAKPMSELAEVLLRGPSSLTMGERELIASFVSSENLCKFCTRSHSAFAEAYLDGNTALVEQVKLDFESAPISNKLKALLRVAKKVQVLGNTVQRADIDAAKQEGASDVEIHDAVLIAAAFCMYNRYVDGLGSWTPEDPAIYKQSAQRIVTEGYMTSFPRK